MDVFSQITANPEFAAGVTEIVYDARLFLGEIAAVDQLHQKIGEMPSIGTNENDTAAGDVE